MGIFFNAYAESDLFGKLIFIALYALSIVSWIVIIQKSVAIFKLQRLSNGFEKRVMKNRGRILDLASKSASPFGQIYWVMREKALALLGKNRHFSGEGNPTFLSRSDMEFLEMQMGAAMEREVKGLEKNLFVLSTVVSLAPFLGILGTVWGILIALFEMQGGSSLHSSSVIMGGLSMALATTVLGLVIAIPALIAHNYLRNMIRNMHREMHEFGNEVLGVIELQFRKVEL